MAKASSKNDGNFFMGKMNWNLQINGVFASMAIKNAKSMCAGYLFYFTKNIYKTIEPIILSFNKYEINR